VIIPHWFDLQLSILYSADAQTHSYGEGEIYPQTKDNHNCLGLIQKAKNLHIICNGDNLDWYFACNIHNQLGVTELIWQSMGKVPTATFCQWQRISIVIQNCLVSLCATPCANWLSLNCKWFVSVAITDDFNYSNCCRTDLVLNLLQRLSMAAMFLWFLLRETHLKKMQRSAPGGWLSLIAKHDDFSI
jgi:hypothetical protein